MSNLRKVYNSDISRKFEDLLSPDNIKKYLESTDDTVLDLVQGDLEEAKLVVGRLDESDSDDEVFQTYRYCERSPPFYDRKPVEKWVVLTDDDESNEECPSSTQPIEMITDDGSDEE